MFREIGRGSLTSRKRFWTALFAALVSILPVSSNPVAAEVLTPHLLLAHLDVVPANREDWSLDPFKLIEKDGYFYARGSGDDKYMAAAFVTNLIRYKQEGYKPDRDIIIALETDEEILDRDSLGIQWLLN